MSSAVFSHHTLLPNRDAQIPYFFSPSNSPLGGIFAHIWTAVEFLQQLKVAGFFFQSFFACLRSLFCRQIYLGMQRQRIDMIQTDGWKHFCQKRSVVELVKYNSRELKKTRLVVCKNFRLPKISPKVFITFPATSSCFLKPLKPTAAGVFKWFTSTTHIAFEIFMEREFFSSLTSSM